MRTLAARLRSIWTRSIERILPPPAHSLRDAASSISLADIAELSERMSLVETRLANIASNFVHKEFPK